MKHKSILRRLTAALLSCTLCCTCLTVPAFSVEESEELPSKFDLRDEGAMTSVKTQTGETCWAYAVIACAESNLIRKGMADSSVDLSEAHLIWFTNGQDARQIRMTHARAAHRTKALTATPPKHRWSPRLSLWQHGRA